MNILQANDKVIKYLNFYSISGNIISTSDSNYLDYSNRFRALYDTAQRTIATTAKKIRKFKHISQNPIPNQLYNELSAFDIVQYLDTDIVYSALNSRAYTFKIDNVATIHIEEEISGVWTNIETIYHLTPTGEFTEYKGTINPSSATNNVRIRFTGLYPYNFRDVALFAYAFPNDAAIPQYQRYNIYTMPTDFFKLNRLISKGSPSEGMSYNPSDEFYWEGNVLAVNYYHKCEYSVEYFAYPTTTIDDTTLDTYEFEIDDEACEAIPYFVASMMMMHENPSIGNKLFAMYQGVLDNLDDSVKDGRTSVKNTLFGSVSNNIRNISY
jgi:hypothetical protein